MDTVNPSKIPLSISAGTNALTAGGIFTFPLMAPVFAEHFKLTQPQLTTIILAGMAGQYPFSSVVGKLSDRFGPHICSLAASISFALAFGTASWTASTTGTTLDSSGSSELSFYLLTVSFAIAGLGTVLSYFSSVFAASRAFPNHMGLTSGLTMALFGLSPLFLSTIATAFFLDASGTLLAQKFLAFLAFITSVGHFVGAFTMRVHADTESAAAETEGEPLLSGQSSKPQVNQNVGHLLRDANFWLLGLYLLINLGICEMVFSNIGSIVASLALLPPSDSSTLRDSTPSQIRILALCNTISRLLIGPLGDLLLFQRFTDGRPSWRISRISVFCAASSLICLASAWMLLEITSESSLWILTGAIGISYGVIFTLLPSIMSAVWGPSNLARNFGVITYAPFLGTPIYSYLYAYVASSGYPDGLCVGRVCWIKTFAVCFVSSVLTFVIALRLRGRWKNQL